MSNCIAPGWGTGAWGQSPWGGALTPDIGGPLPFVLPFDIYCVGPCGPISTILTHTGVSTVGDGSQLPIDPVTLDQELDSGGDYETTDAAMILDVGVPSNFTFEFTVFFEHLPPDFSNIPLSHAYFGTFAAAGGCVGLFFSKIGLAYTGSVHLDSSNTLVLDTPVQDLPGSQVLVSEGEYWTIRLAMSFSTGAVYVYVTRTADLPTLGHQLRYVLPAIPSSSAAVTPPSETFVSVRGTLTAPTYAALNSICLGTGLVIPALQPIANAGVDQAIQFCEILRLDGSASYDPQAAPLTYLWQLVDAPPGSQYLFDGTDGLTYPLSPPTGFTNRLYSADLGTLNGTAPISSGDIIVLGGTVYVISGTGTDVDGFFVLIDGYVVPDDLSSPTTFKYLPQNGLNTPTVVRPTFYPDVAGIWKFNLTVFNGALFSEPSEMICNVVVTAVARGCTPDLSFIWNYLSDFWNLIDDSQRITTFWQGLAQVAAAELLRLWQVDYNKSLRDIQRTFQRRWLHYDLLMQESPTLIALSTVRAVYSGVESINIANAGITGVAGTHLDIQFSIYSFPTIISFTAPNPYTPDAIAAIMQAAFAQLDARIIVREISARAGNITRLRIDAPFPFSVLTTSTCPIYSVGQMNGAPTGTLGASVVSLSTYRVERSLQYLDIELNDFLCIDGVAYRIANVVDDPSDPFYFQRLVLLDALPSPADTVWTIAGTVVSQDLDFWNGLCEVSDIVTYEVINNQTNAITTLQGPVLGSCEALTANLPVDATIVGSYLATPAVYSVYLFSVLRRKYIPLDPLIVDVPLLQEIIQSTDDTAVLRRNVDFFVDTFRGQNCLRFITPVPSDAGGNDVWEGQAPPPQLWAETSFLDNRPAIEGNFGIPANFTLDDLAQLPSNVDYLSAVQGLWYAYWNGPTVFNLRAGTQILLGLPFAEQAGTILSVRDDFSVTQGQILVQDLANTAIVREYTWPPSLPLETNPTTGKPYVVGDTVAQFAPLVQGVEVDDYISDPTWFQGYLEQGVFFEVEKFFKFLVRVDAAAFNLQALLFARSFVLRIKPTYTYPLFVVLEALGTTGDTTVDTSDSVSMSGTLSLFAGACFAGSELPILVGGTADMTSASLYGTGGSLAGKTLGVTVNGESLSVTFNGSTTSASQAAALAAISGIGNGLSARLGGNNGTRLLLFATESLVIHANGTSTANTVLGLTSGVYMGGSTRGAATMFDQPNPAGGGWVSQYDHAPGTGAPTFPTPNYPVYWGFDKNYLCPEDAIMGTCSSTFSFTTTPYFDGIFQFDQPLYTEDYANFSAGSVDAVTHVAPGTAIGAPFTLGSTVSIQQLTLEINALRAGSPNTYALEIWDDGYNSGPVITVDFTLPNFFPPGVGAVLGGTSFAASGVGFLLTFTVTSVEQVGAVSAGDNVVLRSGAAAGKGYAVRTVNGVAVVGYQPNAGDVIVAYGEFNGGTASDVVCVFGDYNPAGFTLTQAVTPAGPTNSGSTLTCYIRSTGTGIVPVEWTSVLVTLGQAVSWAFDETVPAGTYFVYKDM
jgi:hypothetical protein